MKVEALIPTRCLRKALPLSRTLETKGIHSVVVCDSMCRHSFSKLEEAGTARVICSRSPNFAYLRNLGTFFVREPWTLYVDDDEVIDSALLSGLSTLDDGMDAYTIFVRTSFAGKLVHMWSWPRIRLVRTQKVHWIGRVHEALCSRDWAVGRLPGHITNQSFDNWNHYWAKHHHYISIERKSPRIIINRSIGPLFVYLRYGGVQDGSLGLKILLASLEYGLRVALIATSGFRFMPLSDLRRKLEFKSSVLLSTEERTYLSWVVDRLSAGFIPPGSSLDEELEQLTSALYESLPASTSTSANSRSKNNTSGEQPSIMPSHTSGCIFEEPNHSGM